MQLYHYTEEGLSYILEAIKNLAYLYLDNNNELLGPVSSDTTDLGDEELAWKNLRYIHALASSSHISKGILIDKCVEILNAMSTEYDFFQWGWEEEAGLKVWK